MKLSELPADLRRKGSPTRTPPKHSYYSELPSDLRVMDRTLPEPPNWYVDQQRVSQASLLNLFPFLRMQTGRLGEREEESEGSSELNNLKYKNLEMNKEIPSVAGRYTSLDPFSPFFRTDRAEYGYGNYGDATTISLVSLAALSSVICAYHGYKRSHSITTTAGWAITGLLLPVVGPLAAVAQGFAKEKPITIQPLTD